MKKTKLILHNIPLNTNYDVIVIGGGPAGCTAAIAASNEGAKTLLIESTTALGGMSTMGLVPNWCPFTDREQVIYKGLAEKIFRLAKKGLPHVTEEAIDWVAINPEYLKSVYDDLVREANVDVLFQTTLAHATVDQEKRIKEIFVVNKAGLTGFQASVYIDTTGDADLVAFAGGSFSYGTPDGEIQSQTHCFILSNVNGDEFSRGPWLNRANKQSPAYQIMASRHYPLVQDPHMCAKLIGPNTVGFNAGHVPTTDVLEPFSLSKAYMEGRQLASQIHQGLQEFHPLAFKNSFLVTTAPLLGIRESRRIIGDYTLTLEDYASRRTFEDEVCRNNYFLDLHPVTRGDGKEMKPKLRIEVPGYKKGESHGIPYRCFIPKDFTNVLVAGRSISVEREVQGSIRVMPAVMVMGEAVGVASAIAVKNKGSVRSIEINHLRDRLRNRNIYIK